VIIIEDTRQEYGEIRFIGIGILENRFVVVVSLKMKKKTVEGLSLYEKQQKKKGKFMKTSSESDWKRVDAMKDEDINTSDVPELDASMFVNAKILLPQRKEAITLRVDNDLLEWYKSLGKGYQTRMNAVLRLYMKTKQNENRSVNKNYK
jgi:uncharacterized protein (DUF4415 family)